MGSSDAALATRNNLQPQRRERPAMKILGMKPGHDGAIALIDNGELVYSIESEKNSFPRFFSITPSTLLEAAEAADAIPDCIALGG